MAGQQIEFGSKAYGEIINQTYDEGLLKCLDIAERE